MKIVQLITRMDEIGGAQVHVKDLSLALTKLGHKVSVVSKGQSSITTELTEQDIPYIQIPHLIRNIHPYYDMKAFDTIRNEFKKLNPDLIATHSSKAGLLGRYAGWSLGIPTIFTAHGWAFTEGVSLKKQVIYKWLEKWGGRKGIGVITVSNYDYQLAIKNKIITKEKIKIIHNGVLDISPHLRAIPQKQPPRLIMVARFAAPKDYAFLIRALVGIHKVDWILDLVGDGPMRPEIERLVAYHRLSHKIRFWGSVDDVPQLLSRSQIFILASNWEGLPLCLIEAMRSGLPIIASDVGGVHELVQHSRNGYLFPRGNLDSLRKSLCHLLENPELRLLMGMRGRELYEKQFILKKMVTNTLDFYEQVQKIDIER